MPNDFLFQLLRALSPNDLPRLRKFLQSPYFNRREDVLLLYDYLLECRPTDFQQFNKQTAYARLFPGDAYDNLRLNHIFNYLAQLVERYFALEEIQSDEALLQLRQCRALRRRGIAQLFERRLRQATRQHSDSPYRNAEFYLHEYGLLTERFAWEAMRTRNAHALAPDAGAALANFFMLENLRWACTVESARAVSAAGANYRLPLSEAVLDAAAAMPEAEMPTLALLHQSLLALRDNADEQQFLKLHQLLLRNVQLLPPPEARDVFMSAINFAIRRHNRGESTYTRLALDLYRAALKQGVLADEGRLPRYTFINIFNLAQLAGDTAWAQVFIEDYRYLLPEADRENIHRYCQAGLHFRQGNYSNVLELLREVEFSEVFINLDVRKMLLRSYFELEEWAALYSLLDSFRSYLRRQKDLGYHREGYLSLIRFTKKLMRISRQASAASTQLATQIRAAQFVAEREWLLRKLED
ncbi:MAG: hypothetical protein H6574_09990 [Lewinellaceae bacterium]|nr:hypothetical protein [Lewinellaceae bacterium]